MDPEPPPTIAGGAGGIDTDSIHLLQDDDAEWEIPPPPPIAAGLDAATVELPPVEWGGGDAVPPPCVGLPPPLDPPTAVASALTPFAGVVCLHLDDVALWSDGVAALAPLLPLGLRSLSLSNVQLGHRSTTPAWVEHGVSAVLAAANSGGNAPFQSGSTVVRGPREPCTAGAQALGEALGTLEGLARLVLSRNALSGEALRAFVGDVGAGGGQQLRWGLTSLDLSKNTLRGQAAAVSLRAIVAHNPLLRLRTGSNGQEIERLADESAAARLERHLLAHTMAVRQRLAFALVFHRRPELGLSTDVGGGWAEVEQWQAQVGWALRRTVIFDDDYDDRTLLDRLSQPELQQPPQRWQVHRSVGEGAGVPFLGGHALWRLERTARPHYALDPPKPIFAGDLAEDDGGGGGWVRRGEFVALDQRRQRRDSSVPLHDVRPPLVSDHPHACACQAAC